MLHKDFLEDLRGKPQKFIPSCFECPQWTYAVVGFVVGVLVSSCIWSYVIAIKGSSISPVIGG